MAQKEKYSILQITQNLDGNLKHSFMICSMEKATFRARLIPAQFIGPFYFYSFLSLVNVNGHFRIIIYRKLGVFGITIENIRA